MKCFVFTYLRYFFSIFSSNVNEKQMIMTHSEKNNHRILLTRQPSINRW